MTEAIRMRRDLTEDIKQPVWPPGVSLAPLAAASPQALYDILSAAYATGFGSVPPFEQWWAGLTADSEFQPELVFVAVDNEGNPIGLAQCWSSGFVKDLAVSDKWRGKGIGEALLITAFQGFREQGLAHVDLKVVAHNAPAMRLYRRVAMSETPS